MVQFGQQFELKLSKMKTFWQFSHMIWCWLHVNILFIAFNFEESLQSFTSFEAPSRVTALLFQPQIFGLYLIFSPPILINVKKIGILKYPNKGPSFPPYTVWFQHNLCFLQVIKKIRLEHECNLSRFIVSINACECDDKSEYIECCASYPGAKIEGIFKCCEAVIGSVESSAFDKSCWFVHWFSWIVL